MADSSGVTGLHAFAVRSAGLFAPVESGQSLRTRLRQHSAEPANTDLASNSQKLLPDPAQYRERVSVIEASTDAGARLQKRNDLSFSVQRALRDYTDTESAVERDELSNLLGVDIRI